MADPADYPWSSHSANAFGRHDPLVHPRAAYLALSPEPIQRLALYRSLVMEDVDPLELDAIRHHLQRQHACGSDRFRHAIEAQLGRCAGPSRIGRPTKRDSPDPQRSSRWPWFPVVESSAAKKRESRTLFVVNCPPKQGFDSVHASAHAPPINRCRLINNPRGTAMRAHIVAILLVALTGTAHASQNLLQNGNFGINPVPSWIPVPISLVYTHVMADGQPVAPSVDITTSGTGSSGQGLYQCVATTPGRVYRATAKVKRTSGVPTTTISGIGIAAAFYTGANCSGTLLGLANATISPNVMVLNAWTNVDSGPVTAPAGTVNALVGLGANAANTEVYTFRGDSAYFGLADVLFSAGFEND